MRSRRDVDPELHILRSAVQRLEGKARHSVESARFNLFAAFESRDPNAARRWAKALRAALLALPDEAEQLRQLSMGALDDIERAIDE